MPKGNSCSVASCTWSTHKAKKQGVTMRFFTFPSDVKVRREWVLKCYRNDRFEPDHGRICSTHFTMEDYEDALKAQMLGYAPKCLKKTAVPSLRIPVEVRDKLSKRNRKPRGKKARTKVTDKTDLTTLTEVKTCCILRCENTSNEAIIDFFPLSSALITPTWVNECCKESTLQEIDKAWICSAHFMEEAFITSLTGSDFVRTLASNVVPILNLPNATSEIQRSLSDDEEDRGSVQQVKFECDEVDIKLEADELSRLEGENEEMARCIEEEQAAIDNMEKDLLQKKHELKSINDQIAKEPEELDDKKEMELLSKVFSKSQLRMLTGRQKTRWLDDDMAVAYTIRHLSNERTYQYLTKKLNIPLPGLSSIKKWLYNKANSKGNTTNEK